MVTNEPNVQYLERYSLAMTAKILGVSPSTIKRWTRAGKMKCSHRQINNRPTWSGEEILRVWKSTY